MGTLKYRGLLALFLLTNVAATRYLSPTGTDAGDGTSRLGAWKTLSYANDNATAGDTITVMDGTWDSTDCPCNDTLTVGGSAGDLTYFIPDAGATPVFDAGVRHYSECSGRAFFIGSDGDYVRFEDLTFRDYEDSTGSAATIYGIASGETLGVVDVIDCTFEASSKDSITTAISLDSNSAGGWGACTVSGNTITSAGNNGIRVESIGSSTIERNSIYRSPITAISNNGNYGIAASGNATLVQKNTIYGMGVGVVIPSSTAGAAPPSDSLRVENNMIVLPEAYGISLAETSIVVKWNTIVKPQWIGINFTDGPDHIVRFNTIHSLDSQPANGAFVSIGGGSDAGLRIENNIFAYASGNVLGFVSDVIGDATKWHFDRNVWYDDALDNWQVGFAGAHDWSDWQGTDNEDPHGAFEDPKLKCCSFGSDDSLSIQWYHTTAAIDTVDSLDYVGASELKWRHRVIRPINYMPGGF